MRRKTYLEAKIVQNLASVLHLHDSMFKLVLHAKAKTSVLPTTLAVILSAVALPIVPKVEFNFEVILYITVSVYLRLLCTFRSIIFFKSGFLSQNIGRSVIFNLKKKN